MRRSRDILQNFLPLLGRWGRASRREEADLFQGREGLGASLALPDWPAKPIEWRALEDSARVREAFLHLREMLYDWNRRSKTSPGSPSKMRCEAGQLQGLQPYFFMQPWNEMGFLFEMTPRGWIVARAERIVSSEQFMRERSAWDHVILYAADELPDSIRVKSDQLGDEMISLSLYEDAMLRLFTELYIG